MTSSSTATRRAPLGAGQPLRGDRIHRYVTAFCPLCHETNPPLAQVRRLSGALMVRDDRVWLERGCPDHGLVRTLYDESPEILAYLEKWQAPTKQHVPDTVDNYRPVPEAYAYGLPAMQTPAPRRRSPPADRGGTRPRAGSPPSPPPPPAPPRRRPTNPAPPARGPAPRRRVLRARPRARCRGGWPGSAPRGRPPPAKMAACN